jgi:hypothetical protein
VRVAVAASGDVVDTTMAARWYQRGTKKRQKAAIGSVKMAKRKSGMGEVSVCPGDNAATSANPPAPARRSEDVMTRRR